MNKVETAVIAYFDLEASQLLSPEQKELVRQKLSNRINSRGELVVKAQTHRTQLQNREEAIAKVGELVTRSLQKKKMRIGTKPSKAAKEKRIGHKKKNAERKEERKKLRPGQF